MARMVLPKGVPRESYLTPIRNDTLRYWVSWLIQRFWLTPICFVLYRLVNRTVIHGAENFDAVDGESFFLCPNHTSAFDGPITGVYITSSLARFLDPSVHWTVVADPLRMVYRAVQYWCIWMGVIPVDRKAGMEQFCLQDALRVVSQGDRNVVFGLYPEGTRSQTGRMARRGKVGIGWFVKRTGKKVVPMYHKGIPGMPWGRRTVEVWIGKPMDFSHYADEPDAPLTWKMIANDVVEELRRMEAVAYGEETHDGVPPGVRPLGGAAADAGEP